MKLSHPVQITPRLLAGVKVGEAWVSIQEHRWTTDGRTEWTYHIDLGDFEHTAHDLRSGVGGGTIQEGLESLLSFLGAFAEAIGYRERTGRDSENIHLFPWELAEWASANSDEFSMLAEELAESTLIEE